MHSLSKRWLNPQAVPRGFLRLYALTALSRGPETGYSLIQKIDERTDGAWRPGPGTMYPTLKGLVVDGLARAAPGVRSPGPKVYTITSEGRKALSEMRGRLAGLGRKERVIARLFSDILPPAVYVPLVINRYREGAIQLREKLSETPAQEREAYLKELRLFMETQMGWIDSQLQPLRAAARGPSQRPHSR
ncbi:MAG: PadR family transcriptional regulator [Nitrososphaerota archaeon]|nr:PadR family transcriptional regulator [Nitrososphaerota archaeon]